MPWTGYRGAIGPPSSRNAPWLYDSKRDKNCRANDNSNRGSAPSLLIETLRGVDASRTETRAAKPADRAVKTS